MKKPINKEKLAEEAAKAAAANGSPEQLPLPEPAAVAARIKANIEVLKKEANPFPVDAFPKPIANVVKHWHEVYSRPTDFHGGSILAAAAAAIGNAVWVEHIEGDVEPLSTWIVLVGPPSSAKSPIMRACLKPLFQNEKTYSKEQDEAKTAWEQQKAANAQLANKQPELPRPTRQQRIVSDATIEAIIKLLLQPKNWKGLLLFKDEFIALLKAAGQYKNGGQDIEHLMSMWSGIPVILNRSSMDDAGFIEQVALNMLGSTQPGILHKLADNNQLATGLTFRLRFAWADSALIPLPTKKAPNPAHMEYYCKVIQRLNSLPGREDKTPTVLKLAPDAFKAYEEWRIDIEQNIINPCDDENIKSLYGKVISYCLRDAAILDLLEFVSEGDDHFFEIMSNADLQKHLISKASVKRAIRIADYFTKNSLKILARTESPVAAMNARNRALYEALPEYVTTAFAIEVGEKMNPKMSESTVKRLIYNSSLFRQAPGGYRKIYT